MVTRCFVAVSIDLEKTFLTINNDYPPDASRGFDVRHNTTHSIELTACSITACLTLTLLSMLSYQRLLAAAVRCHHSIAERQLHRYLVLCQACHSLLHDGPAGAAALPRHEHALQRGRLHLHRARLLLRLHVQPHVLHHRRHHQAQPADARNAHQEQAGRLARQVQATHQARSCSRGRRGDRCTGNDGNGGRGREE